VKRRGDGGCALRECSGHVFSKIAQYRNYFWATKSFSQFCVCLLVGTGIKLTLPPSLNKANFVEER